MRNPAHSQHHRLRQFDAPTVNCFLFINLHTFMRWACEYPSPTHQIGSRRTASLSQTGIILLHMHGGTVLYSTVSGSPYHRLNWRSCLESETCLPPYLSILTVRTRVCISSYLHLNAPPERQNDPLSWSIGFGQVSLPRFFAPIYD